MVEGEKDTNISQPGAPSRTDTPVTQVGAISMGGSDTKDDTVRNKVKRSSSNPSQDDISQMTDDQTILSDRIQERRTSKFNEANNPRRSIQTAPKQEEILEAEKVDDIESNAVEVAREALEQVNQLKQELEKQREMEHKIQSSTVVAVATPHGDSDDDEDDDEEVAGDDTTKDRLPCIVSIVCVIVILVILILVFTVGGSDDDDKTVNPPATTTEAPTVGATSLRRGAIDTILNDTLAAAFHEEAYRWITEVDSWSDPVQDLTDPSLSMDAVNAVWRSRYMLALLYYQTNGDNWTDKTNWLTPTSVCDWFVAEEQVCQGNQPNVATFISLFGNNLSNEGSGTLPTEISLHKELTVLNLESNRLSGTIPVEYCTMLTNLGKFDMSNNLLVGTIPTEVGLLTDLTKLDLEVNQLTGAIPSEIGLLTSMTKLELGPNSLSSTVPTEIGLLGDKCRYIDMEKNNLSGPIPSEIGQLKGLTYLRMSENSFTGTVPAQVLALAGDKIF